MDLGSVIWNPWHGCTRYSEGCRHCYVYRRDESVGRDPATVYRTGDFSLPQKKRRDGSHKLSGENGMRVYTCLTSDFFLPAADPFREEAWQMMKDRPDLTFYIITKRAKEAVSRLPADWGEGYANVILAFTVENQRRADERLPLIAAIPAARKELCVEPMLEAIDFRGKLRECGIRAVSVGGESGPDARICDFDWVRSVARQCADEGLGFRYHQTGACLRKDGRLYRIPRKLQASQARKAGLDHD